MADHVSDNFADDLARQATREALDRIRVLTLALKTALRYLEHPDIQEAGAGFVMPSSLLVKRLRRTLTEGNTEPDGVLGWYSTSKNEAGNE